ncbi:hypothetical protein RHGRI_001918 [Rhododendron griersonianum]|uniref:AB hydrolase-1 domain-containing protein n=1 Tax=Rhododendron griersonianum TaxID=479676 RepID=A0AAV6LLY0_9ERIC|nr:hypothetical protein RHGRI_001918 [Rhododendron griersonianum]
MTCACSCFSIISLCGTYIRHTFSAAGLSAKAIDIDSKTAIHFWGPKSSPDPTNPKPPLVFLHGFGPDAHWHWYPQVLFFAREFALYVPNLVFFGDSTTTSAERSEVFQVSVGRLMQKLGVERYYVVGTSYGGFMAYHMAVMWPERVEKVVIASSAVNMRHRDNVEFLEERAK